MNDAFEMTPDEIKYGWWVTRRLRPWHSFATPPDHTVRGVLDIYWMEDLSRGQARKRWEAWSEYISALDQPVDVSIRVGTFRQNVVDAVAENENIIAFSTLRWPRALKTSSFEPLQHIVGLNTSLVGEYDMEVFTHLPRLRVLNLTGGSSGLDLAPLAHTRLHQFSLRSTALRTLRPVHLEAVGRIQSLRHLNIQGTRSTPPFDPMCLADLRHLTTLSVSAWHAEHPHWERFEREARQIRWIGEQWDDYTAWAAEQRAQFESHVT